MIPTVTFKAKIHDVHYYGDGHPAYQYIKVPALSARHCDMPAFRSSQRFRGYANSDLFPAVLKREVRRMGIGERIRLDQLPEGVSVDTSKFLAVVTIAFAD